MRRARGIDGCLLTDLSVEEAEPYVGAMRNAGLDTVFLAAPTSTQRRLEVGGEIFHRLRLFGFANRRHWRARHGLRRRRAAGQRHAQSYQLPLAVGFGISNADQVRQVGAVADGVVVGSAIVRVVEQNAASARTSGQAGSSGPRARQWFTIEESMSMERLAECRKQIDVLDMQMLALLNERTRMVEEIGRIKQDALAAHLRAEARRSSVPQCHNPQPRPADRRGVKRVFERIIDEMRNIQRDKML